MVRNESKYAKVALQAASLASTGTSPVSAWKTAAAEVFSSSPSGERKSCPKSAFLGLAEAGEIAAFRLEVTRNLQTIKGTRKQPSYFFA